MATFAERLKELRKEKQLTVEQLANNIGSAKSTISRYENGREPKGDIIRLLTNYFNVSIDYLMGISDDRKPSTDKETIDFFEVKFDNENLKLNKEDVEALLNKLKNIGFDVKKLL